jgi:hypothetical protein
MEEGLYKKERVQRVYTQIIQEGLPEDEKRHSRRTL